ncbi:MAG: sigma-70 family RNA polymerase sigma factor [Pirellulaceae bacterium]|nr:sigma-70 family RNA polymerase sigma factor [Pirellulaceae bacterium]
MNDTRFEEFISLFMRHQARLARYVLVLLPHASDAEDVVQETAITLWRRFDEYKPGTNFHAWACRTAYLKILEHRRRCDSRQAILDPDVLENLAVDFSVQNECLDAQLGALRDCLGKLRHGDRELVERRYMKGERGDQIAMDLGRPANSVYQSLGRIRRTLLECVNRALAVAGPRGETI